MSIAIDKATKLVETLAKVASLAASIDRNQDGKIDLNETITVVQAFILEGINVFGDFNEGLNQLRNADSEAMKTLVEAFKVKFDLPNDDLESLIEDWISVVLEVVDIVQYTSKYLKQE